jgi:hypothetical protein
MASNSLASRVISTYTTFSGIDITAIFDNLIMATLSGLATSLTREKVPVYTFGSANARSISRGKRACAGSMQFTLFDRDSFYNMFLDESHYYYAHADEVNYLTNPINIAAFVGTFFPGNANNNFAGQTGLQGGDNTLGGIRDTNFAAAGPQNRNGTDNRAGQSFGVAGANASNGIAGALSVRRAAQHADQVYPFDITMAAQNEYGRASSSAIIGVEIINEGGGVSVDDITNEQQMTYIAITKTPWVPITTGDDPSETMIGRIRQITNPNNNLASPDPQFNQVAAAP